MKKYILFVLFYLSLLSCSAQITFNRVYRTDANESFATLFSGIEVVNDTIYMSGQTIDTTDGPPRNKGLFNKFDLEGNRLFQRFYIDRPNERTFEMRTVTSEFSSENACIINAGLHRNRNAFIMKQNLNGDTLFVKDFHSNNPSYGCYITSFLELENKKMILLLNESYDDKLYVIKTDSLGNELWRKLFSKPLYGSRGVKMIIIQNDIYILGYLYKMSTGGPSQMIESKMWLIKTDTAGNQIDEFVNDDFQRHQIPTNMTLLEDGSFAICGAWYPEPFNQYQSKIYTCKMNAGLQMIWESFLESDYAVSRGLIEKNNHHLVGIGFSPNELGEMAAVFFELSPIGDSLYIRYIKAEGLPTGIGEQYPEFTDFEQLDNGDYIISGFVIDPRLASPTAGYWGWLVRTDSMGCVQSGCNMLDVTKQPVGNDTKVTARVYPNPANDQTTISLELSDGYKNEDFTLKLYDVFGRELYTAALDNGSRTYTVNTENYAAGLYWLKVVSLKGDLVGSQKIIIIKN